MTRITHSVGSSSAAAFLLRVVFAISQMSGSTRSRGPPPLKASSSTLSLASHSFRLYPAPGQRFSRPWTAVGSFREFLTRRRSSRTRRLGGFWGWSRDGGRADGRVKLGWRAYSSRSVERRSTPPVQDSPLPFFPPTSHGLRTYNCLDAPDAESQAYEHQ